MHTLHNMRISENSSSINDGNTAHSIKVLLIEDNPADAQLLGEILERFDSTTTIRLTHEATIAGAIKYMNGHPIDVMLIDFSLPDSHGLETFKMLRERFPNIPIIILTGNDSADLAIKALKIGAQDYISKNELEGRLLIRSLRYAVERHRLQMELHIAHKRQLLSQKLESLGLIAGGVAHDFNNLLGAISGNAELAELKSPQAGQAHEFLRNIITACKRGGELCNQLMAFSGKGYLELSVCDLNELIQDLLPLMSVSLSKKDEIQYKLMDDIPMVEVDDVQIRQIIMNLLTNASDALEDKTGNILIETGIIPLDDMFMQGNFWGSSSVQESQDYVYIKVKDNGSGMTNETIAKIFDPFFTTKFSGRGLGLAAVLGIIQAHHGALKVDSQLGAGSCFWCLLPISNKKKTLKTEQQSISEQWQGHGRILIADDESDLRDALNHYLQSIGFETILAADGLQALEKFKQHKNTITAVLLDMTMPKMNGKDIYEQIIQIVPDMKVLLMSGYTEKKIDSEFNKGSAHAFIKKPFRLRELNEAIQQLLVE